MQEIIKDPIKLTTETMIIPTIEMIVLVILFPVVPSPTIMPRILSIITKRATIAAMGSPIKRPIPPK